MCVSTVFGADHEPAGDCALVEPFGQHSQHVRLAWRERRADQCPRTVHLVSPPQEQAHALDELVRGQRLGQVVVASDEQTRDAIERLGPLPGNEEDRDRLPYPPP